MITCSDEAYSEPPPQPPSPPVERGMPFQLCNATDEIRIDWISAVDKHGRHWPILLRPGFEIPPEMLHPDFVSASAVPEPSLPA